jgi:hypothetical protein
MTITQVEFLIVISALACVGGLLYAVLRERSDHRAHQAFHGKKW